MLLIRGSAADLRRGWTRRDCLRVGFGGALSLLGARPGSAEPVRDTTTIGATRTFGQARSCIFIYLFGGPSHIDIWDLKPGAPAEIRGEFKPVATRVPGIRLCEHLPLLAGQTDKLCLLRSMTHRMPVHGPACSELYSGRPYFGPPTTD